MNDQKFKTVVLRFFNSGKPGTQAWRENRPESIGENLIMKRSLQETKLLWILHG